MISLLKIKNLVNKLKLFFSMSRCKYFVRNVIYKVNIFVKSLGFFYFDSLLVRKVF